MGAGPPSEILSLIGELLAVAIAKERTARRREARGASEPSEDSEDPEPPEVLEEDRGPEAGAEALREAGEEAGPGEAFRAPLSLNRPHTSGAQLARHSKENPVALERTLFIVKPDAVGRNQIGRILAHVEDKGFRIVEARFGPITRPDAEEFYAEHQGKLFFGSGGL